MSRTVAPRVFITLENHGDLQQRLIKTALTVGPAALYVMIYTIYYMTTTVIYTVALLPFTLILIYESVYSKFYIDRYYARMSLLAYLLFITAVAI